MRIPAWALPIIQKRVRAVINSRPPDFVIGGEQDPYLLRWFLIPRNRIFNVYVHVFHRSDDDRAHHDHPWLSVSVSVENEATEHRILAGGVHSRRIIKAGEVVFRGARYAHRIELHAGLYITLFITGPKVRSWGFHCPDAGWVDWRKFTAADDPGAIGRGCDQGDATQ